MQFDTFAIEDAVGGILAHSLHLNGGARLRKGIVITELEVKRLKAAGVASIVLAMPDDGDVLEDEAAISIASCFEGENIRIGEARTGRVNIYSETNGLFRVDRTLIDGLNSVDPGIAVSTLNNMEEVNEGRMIATVKIIPYSIPAAALSKVSSRELKQAMCVSAYRPKRIGLIFTEAESTKSSVQEKTKRALERRLELSGSSIVCECRVGHAETETSNAISEIIGKCDIVILFGASAISDVADVIPRAIESSGGTIVRFGMPVDPGNLLLLAELSGKPVLGAPGCARSPAENGFDWVLQRLTADLSVSSAELTRMGVGGLLMETGARPNPRERPASAERKHAAIVLAAGQSRRMGDTNKMTVEFNGKPMVRHVVESVLDAPFDEVFVVVGHKQKDVKDALEGCAVKYVENPDYADGLSTSLRSGVGALNAEHFATASILLGDMPFVTSRMMGSLVEVSRSNPDKIVLATANGKRRNPVLWPALYFQELKNISGDVGAKHIVGKYDYDVVEVELGDAATMDFDTPESLKLHNKDN